MDNKDTPAFPHIAFDQDGTYTTDPEYKGLTKREYFAAIAMQGMLVNSFVIGRIKGQTEAITESFVASQAVKFADELLNKLSE